MQDIDNFIQCAAGFDEGLAIVAANSTGKGKITSGCMYSVHVGTRDR